MPSVKDTPQAMETMADRAALQDLRDMLAVLLILRTHLVPQDRTRLDSLVLRLERLLGHPSLAQQTRAMDPFPELELRLQCPVDSPVTGYVVHLFDADTGGMVSSTTRDTFEAALQLVRRRLGIKRDYYIAGTWTGQIGRLAITTPLGQVLARIEPRESDPTHCAMTPPHPYWRCGSVAAGAAVN